MEECKLGKQRVPHLLLTQRQKPCVMSETPLRSTHKAAVSWVFLRASPQTQVLREVSAYTAGGAGGVDAGLLKTFTIFGRVCSAG